MRTRIFLVDDHVVVRRGLGMLLEIEPTFEVCGEAGTAGEALEQIPDAAPDVVLVDLSLPGMHGLDLIEALLSTTPGVRILVVSGNDEGLYAPRALEAGALGFLDKGHVTEHLLDAVATVRDGQVYRRRPARVPATPRPRLAATA